MLCVEPKWLRIRTYVLCAHRNGERSLSLSLSFFVRLSALLTKRMMTLPKKLNSNCNVGCEEANLRAPGGQRAVFSPLTSWGVVICKHFILFNTKLLQSFFGWEVKGPGGQRAGRSKGRKAPEVKGRRPSDRDSLTGLNRWFVDRLN